MVKAVGNILKGIGLSVAAVLAAPILAISELVGSFASFIG